MDDSVRYKASRWLVLSQEIANLSIAPPRLLDPIGPRPFGGVLCKPFKGMAGTTRLELATSAVTGQRSNQLNYVPKYFYYQQLTRTPKSVRSEVSAYIVSRVSTVYALNQPRLRRTPHSTGNRQENKLFTPERKHFCLLDCNRSRRRHRSGN